MGLDMYLVAKMNHVGGWKHSRDPLFARLVDATGITPDDGSPCFSVSATVGYWRKANAVHRWFVENVQGGTDDCAEYPVSRDQLSELRRICRAVLGKVETVEGPVGAGTSYKAGGVVEHHTRPGRVITNTATAEAVMPTQAGCFFGKTDYDSDYLDDLEDTIEIIDRVLSDKALEGWDITYHASW